jgi:hypothetical protein
VGWVATAVGSVIRLDPAVELYNSLCSNGQNYTVIGPLDIELQHHPLVVCIRKNIQTLYQDAGLGWVATAVGSII